ncbi:hypothetical protein Hte_004198 [Hypoxylon texense]
MKTPPLLRTVKARVQSRLSSKHSHDEAHSQSKAIRDNIDPRVSPLNLCQRCQAWGKINIHSIAYRGIETEPFTTCRENTSVEQLAGNPRCALCAAVLDAYYEYSQALPSLQSWPPQLITVEISGPFYMDQDFQDGKKLSRQADVSDPNYLVVRTLLRLQVKCLPLENLEKHDGEQGSTKQEGQVATATDEVHQPQPFTITPQFKMKYSNEETPVLCAIEGWETPYFDVQVLRNWLQYCDDFHGTQCVAEVNRSAVLPRGFRVIDVQEMSVIQPEDFIHFVALSYMWSCDPGNNLQLEKSNVDEFQAPGSLREITIPGIIADSIALCRDLGERYLWVDRLCIIQDDGIVKLDQINAMDKIYSLATFTIAAALNTRDGIGLPGVSGRPRPSRASVRSQPLNPDVEGQGINLSRLLGTTVSKSLWNKRGWTFQERILSKRRLFITESQVLFQCCEGQATESLTWALSTAPEPLRKADFPTEQYDSEDDDSMSGISVVTKLQRAAEALGFYGFYQRHESAYEDTFRLKETVSIQDYSRWVEDYSARQLSFGTDILNAFAGVESSLSAAWNSKMLYGMPEKYLSICLLWHSENTARRSGDIPHWSWASSLSAVDYSWHTSFLNDDLIQIASLVYFHYQDPSQGLQKLEVQERWIMDVITIEELAKREELPPVIKKHVPGEWRSNRDWRECPQNPWETFKRRALSSDACNVAAMIPGSLVFNTTVASLEIDYTDEHTPEKYKSRDAQLRNRQGEEVGVLHEMEFHWVEARRSTKSSRNSFDFIVLSGELEKWSTRKNLSGYDRWADMWLLDVMLVERLPCKPFVARRVAVGTVKMCKWKDCEPRWETVVLC